MQIYHTSNKFTHISVILVVFPAALRQSKMEGDRWMGGAAVWLTAAAVPYHNFDDSNARRM
jgi:hypothetical protein